MAKTYLTPTRTFEQPQGEVKEQEKSDLAVLIFDLIRAERLDLATGGGILIGAFHALCDWHLGQSTRTLQEIRETKREIGMGLAKLLDVDIDPEVYP